MRAKWRRVSTVCIVGALALNSVGRSSAAGAEGSGGSFAKPGGGSGREFTCSFSECIVVGEQSKWLVWYWCQIGGVYKDDTITPNVANFPKGRGEDKPTYEPSKVPTTHNPSAPANSERSLVTIDTKYFKTSQSTRPGPYSLHFTGKGQGRNGCPTSYDAGTATIQVRPKITAETAENGKQKDVVWWFGNAERGPLEDLGYTLQLELTAHGEDNNYSWTITQDGDYAEFVGGGTQKQTTRNTVKVQASSNIASPDDLPKNKGEFEVTVTVNGAESDPIKLRVKRPYAAKYLGSPDDVADGSKGYISTIFYLVTDQFGKALPKQMPVREHFTGGFVDDYKGTNWAAAEEGGAISKRPAAIQDKVTGQSLLTNPFQVPKATGPKSPLGTTAIHHFDGEVWVGSTNVRGVRIMTLSWQRFRDHARHCNIASPPDAKQICPCGQLRKTGECP